MARYRGSVCRLCRREGEKLYLKGVRCMGEKCAIERRPYAPGQVGQGRRRKFSEYGIQLREKQKVRRIYGVLERQFRRYYYRATRKQGVTGEVLLGLLERRLDNVVYRIGLAASRSDARTLVRHGHVTVNGTKVDIPSFEVATGMEIGVKAKARESKRLELAAQSAESRVTPKWLEINTENMLGKVVAEPSRDDISIPIQEQLIVELYSK